MTLPVLLIFYVLADHLRIKSHCVYTVTLGPKMIAPIGLLLEIWELLEDSYRCSASQASYEVRDQDLESNHANQVDMVWLNIHLHNLAPQLTAENTDAVVNLLTNCALQDTVPVWIPTRDDTDSAI